MNIHKGFLTLAIIGVVLICFVASSVASDRISLFVNGKLTKVGEASQIKNGKVIVPARALAEAMGASIRGACTNRWRGSPRRIFSV